MVYRYSILDYKKQPSQTGEQPVRRLLLLLFAMLLFGIAGVDDIIETGFCFLIRKASPHGVLDDLPFLVWIVQIAVADRFGETFFQSGSGERSRLLCALKLPLYDITRDAFLQEFGADPVSANPLCAAHMAMESTFIGRARFTMRK